MTWLVAMRNRQRRAKGPLGFPLRRLTPLPSVVSDRSSLWSFPKLKTNRARCEPGFRRDGLGGFAGDA